jgi:hypothetical protein
MQSLHWIDINVFSLQSIFSYIKNWYCFLIIFGNLFLIEQLLIKISVTNFRYTERCRSGLFYKYFYVAAIQRLIYIWYSENAIIRNVLRASISFISENDKQTVNYIKIHMYNIMNLHSSNSNDKRTNRLCEIDGSKNQNIQSYIFNTMRLVWDKFVILYSSEKVLKGHNLKKQRLIEKNSTYSNFTYKSITV